MNTFFDYIFLFFLYSMIGWLIEVINALIREKKFVNRGFMLGPYIPIWGTGALLITIFLSRYENDLVSLFVLSAILCGVLEYLVSYYMEKIFKLRWWDYSYKKFNLNGRISLDYLIAFGLLGIFSIKYINPPIISMFNHFSFNTKIIIFLILTVSFLVDYLLSFIITFNLKQITKGIKKDSTDEIKKEIRKRVIGSYALYNRILKAFPKIRKISIKKRK